VIKNILQPTGDQVRGFRDRQTGEPIQMLNLLKFKPKAEYEDGRDADLTGREAYLRYARALIQYPSTQVMLDMLRDPDYQAVQHHRVAALEGQLLIECGAGFSFE
jgi:hypothetical protein